jgi:hypothetical protein
LEQLATGFAVLNVAVVLEGKIQHMACVVGTMQVFEPENNLIYFDCSMLYFHWDL